MEALVAERAKGDFVSLDDFASRIDPKMLNRRQIEALAAGGAFDCIEPDRPRALADAESPLARANSSDHERSPGQGGRVGESIRAERGRGGEGWGKTGKLRVGP